jgi:predicted metal-dependent peptidase
MRDTQETIEDFRGRVARVRCQLLKLEPLLSYLSLEIPTFILAEGDPGAASVETAATDGKRYFFNFAWCRRLTDPELMFVICHEVGHVMFLHATRRNDRDARLWNIACDFVINLLLHGSDHLKGAISMPRDPEPVGYLDEQYANQTAEQVFEKMPKNIAGNSFDLLLDGDADAGAEAIAAGKSAVARALTRTREYRQRGGNGTEPSNLERLAEAGLQPSVRWEAQLQMQAAASGYDAHTWARPNKKMMPHGYYLPSYRGFQLLRTLFVFDTSGSISAAFLGQMAAELNKLLRTAVRSAITVATCDNNMHLLGEFSASRPFKPQQHKLPGGGGTDFRAPFEYAIKHRYEQVLYLTDTIGVFPERAPRGIKTVWLVPAENLANIPFGHAISIPLPAEK